MSISPDLLDQQIEQTLTTLVRNRRWESEPGYIFPAEKSAWLSSLATRVRAISLALKLNGLWLELNQPLWQEGILPDYHYLSVQGVNAELRRELASLEIFAGSTITTRGETSPYPIYHFSSQAMLAEVKERVQERMTSLECRRDENLLLLRQSGPAPVTTAPLELRERYWEPLGVATILESERQALTRYLKWLGEREEAYLGGYQQPKVRKP